MRRRLASKKWVSLLLEIDDGVSLIPAARDMTNINFEVPLSESAPKVLREARGIGFGAMGDVFSTNGTRRLAV
jgi:hypothetical protein